MSAYPLQPLALIDLHPATESKARRFIASNAIDSTDAQELLCALGLVPDPQSQGLYDWNRKRAGGAK
jgi:hypothetical protein